jgi:hypothetical protein
MLLLLRLVIELDCKAVTRGYGGCQMNASSRWYSLRATGSWGWLAVI